MIQREALAKVFYHGLIDKSSSCNHLVVVIDIKNGEPGGSILMIFAT